MTNNEKPPEYLKLSSKILISKNNLITNFGNSKICPITGRNCWFVKNPDDKYRIVIFEIPNSKPQKKYWIDYDIYAKTLDLINEGAKFMGVQRQIVNEELF